MRTTSALAIILLLWHSVNAANIDDLDGFLRDKRFTFASPVKGELNICYDCDKACVDAITAAHLTVDGYFANVASKASQVLNSQLSITLNLLNVQTYPTLDVNLQALVTNKNAPLSQNAKQVNQGYWSSRWAAKKAMGCDVVFLVTVDNFLSQDSITGISTGFSMCRDTAYGILGFSTNEHRMTCRSCHEIGHMMGMRHDDKPVPSTYSSNTYSAWTTDIYEQCPASTASMMNAVEPQSTSLHYSNCAKAYFVFWASYPTTWYKHDCFKTAGGGGGGGDGGGDGGGGGSGFFLDSD